MSVSSDELQERRRRRRGGGADSDSTRSTAAGALPTRPRSHGDDDGQAKKQRRHRADGRGGFSGSGREAHTWRGRLEEGSGAGQNKGKGLTNRPALSSGKKFEDLDNYLRGCASASAAKREKRKRGLRLSRGSGGGESCAGTTADGSSLSFAEGHEVRKRPSSNGNLSSDAAREILLCLEKHQAVGALAWGRNRFFTCKVRNTRGSRTPTHKGGNSNKLAWLA